MTNLPTTDPASAGSAPTLYVGRCTVCGWKTEPLRYVAAGDLTEAHSQTCPEASTEVWPADSTGLSDSHDRGNLPRFVCPAWCTTPHEQHASELTELEGQLVHHGAVDKDRPTEVWLCEATWPAGEPTGDQPTLTVAGSCQELTPAEALDLAKALLAAAEALLSGRDAVQRGLARESYDSPGSKTSAGQSTENSAAHHVDSSAAPDQSEAGR